ncbi:glycoside hydrolase/deacetylase [Rhizoclosmatium globosum]|uniref:Glycoside hydrolase/deacetylase n=1 Tax=Rhizoclosmatium globosum TaxID=329046 RepID=A0A1Y2C5F7_9FUNG|nr:glycoside hydrolase/deacetylase [Rhizoclosmatium globosum]|eukprot:ORY42261.1 glycoside hydrolase/deacetylase [Rhizoclosmatium globosum]
MKATFWVMGSRIMEYPEVLLDAYQAGHEIGIHTFTHPHLPSLNDDQIIAELILTARAIYEVIGEYPRFFRPPFGDIDDRVRNLAKSMGLTAVLWDADSQDWDNVNNTTMSKIPGIFKAWMEKGMNYSISLEHDYWQDTASIAVDCMNILIDSGMIIIPLSECIGVSSVYNNNILQTFFESEIFTDRPKTHPSTRNTASSLVSSSTSFATSTTSNPTTTASVNVQAPQLKSSSVLSQASVIGVLIATMFFLLPDLFNDWS